jgi:iron complex transport system ATP-binding protein
MGRFPHRGYGLFETAEDRGVALRAMKITETEAFTERALSTLSGGESQRVHLAAALAQQPRVFLLDEPTSALDLAHQLAVFDALRRLTHEERVATVAVTHDINLAGHHCDHLALMSEGRIAAQGPSEEVLEQKTLESVYGVSFAVYDSSEDRRRWMLPQGIEGAVR